MRMGTSRRNSGLNEGMHIYRDTLLFISFAVC
jgi:hypothetical protein